jgi:hypothetical protein
LEISENHVRAWLGDRDALSYDERIRRQDRRMGRTAKMIALTNPFSGQKIGVVYFNSRHEFSLPDLLKGVIKVSLPCLQNLQVDTSQL